MLGGREAAKRAPVVSPIATEAAGWALVAATSQARRHPCVTSRLETVDRPE